MSEKNEYVKLWLSYESYFVSYSDAEVGRLARAMIQYRCDGAEPKFCGNERFVWPAIKRDIDESIKAQQTISESRSYCGKQGGRPKKEPEGKQKKQRLFEESKKSHGQGQGQGHGQGQGQGHGQGQGQGQGQEPPNPLAAVMTAYLDKVNPMASQTCLDELKGFCEEMGAECCLRAIDIALDAKKTSWSYIRAILRDKLSAGVKSLADWDELEEARNQVTQNGVTDYAAQTIDAIMNGTYVPWSERAQEGSS